MKKYSKEEKEKKKLRQLAKIATEQRYTALIKPVANILKGIQKKSKENCKLQQTTDKEKFDDLYTLLCKPSLLIQAYGNIKGNKGSLTPGVNQETVDRMSLEKINKIAEELKTNKFKFNKVKRIWIPKPKILKPGEPIKMRPLGIPTFKDRIVQEAIRIILESIYEPIFDKTNCNYGFRPNLGCHHAITRLKELGTGSTIAIEGDIEGAYDNVDHEILTNILRKQIKDNKFIKLLNQGFKSGILDNNIPSQTLTGVPQGGLASPILFNIYMNEFDEFMNTTVQENLKESNRFEDRKNKPRNKSYDRIQVQLDRLRKKYKNIKQDRRYIDLNEYEKKILEEMALEIKELAKLRAKVPSLDERYKLQKIIYVRYADDWIILTNMQKITATFVKEFIADWLLETLKLKLSPQKTKITNLKIDSAKFIGFSLKTYLKRRLTKNEYGELTKRAGWNIVIGVDHKRALEKLQYKGFCNEKFKPVAKRSWSTLEPEEILKRYNYLSRGIANYYFPVIDRLSPLTRLLYITKFSCLSTFAKKYKSKITKITQKYGDPLTINVRTKQTYLDKQQNQTIIETEQQHQLLTYLKLKSLTTYKKYSWKERKKINIPNEDIFEPLKTINWRTYRNLDSVCCICGTNKKVEMHHIKHIRKGKVIGFEQVLKQINRKTIPLCSTHHKEVHQGKYDSIKLSELYGIEKFLY